MKTLRWLSGVLLVGILSGALVVPAQAQKDKAKAAKEANDAALAQDVKDLGAAAELVEFGRKYKAPEALVTAGSLLLKVNALTKGKMAKLEATLEDDKGNKITEPVEKEKPLKEQAEDLFLEAEATTAPGVTALVNAAKARKYTDEFTGRGASGGPKRICRTVTAGNAHVYTIHFHPNELAVISFHSNHSVRFRIISPGQGDLQNSMVTTSRYFWTPRKFTSIKVHVQGLLVNTRYTLTTN